ncbi:MAG TPA: hypothetical protein VJO35_02860 [Terriglobales bacterium]|nr:hypothetical protein [Terriglobales bacterium]
MVIQRTTPPHTKEAGLEGSGNLADLNETAPEIAAIRWDEFPHGELRLQVHSRLRRNALEHSADDSLRHILRRRLSLFDVSDHHRFVELEARRLIEHLRCVRDRYQEFVDKHRCHPVMEAHWVVLRCAVFPTAIELLQGRVMEYAKLTRMPGRDLSLFYGIPTRTCYRDFKGFRLIGAPDLNDNMSASEEEIKSLGQLVNEDTLLWFRDIEDGGAVGVPFGGGPFAIDDCSGMRNSFSLCGSRVGMTLPQWLEVRKSLWNGCTAWTDGLCSLFGAVQEELLSQWSALPSDSLVRELETSGQALSPVVVPLELELPKRLERGKDCEALAKEIGTIKHKRTRGGLTVDEIRRECPFFAIWKRVEVLSDEDKDTFLHPGRWEPGYTNLLLGKLYATARRDVAPATINTWRKEYRAYLKWQKENPSKAANDFVLELQHRKRNYRTKLQLT